MIFPGIFRFLSLVTTKPTLSLSLSDPDHPPHLQVPNSHGRPRLLGALSRAAAEEAQRRLVQEPSAGGAGSARSVELMRLRWGVGDVEQWAAVMWPS